jgi:flavin-dependent dehydrogenase
LAVQTINHFSSSTFLESFSLTLIFGVKLNLAKVNKNKNFNIGNGSKIAVIGGGPAGSFFAYFALGFAEQRGINIHIDIYEAKNFHVAGPAGCNRCGGIVSESLIQALSTDGIVLPANVVRRGIESYKLHMEQGATLIETPLKDQKIASMFRGFGPLGSDNIDSVSFDNYLLELCQKKGVHTIYEKVIGLERNDSGITVQTQTNSANYELVIGSVGLNPRSFSLFKKVIPAYIPPETTRTYICEFKLGNELINQYFGNSMHVFLLNLKNIKFGALIPKGQYVTLVLLGKQITGEIVDSFLSSEAVQRCFPKGLDIDQIAPCQCFPGINIKNAHYAYSDRVVLIGDSASSKLYKNGIGAAYITAKAAAKTAIFNGVSQADFKKHYQPECTRLNRDNAIGKFIFGVTTIIQKSSVLKKGIFRMVVNEQKKVNDKRRKCAVHQYFKARIASGNNTAITGKYGK